MALIQVNYFSQCLMRTVTVNAVIPVDKITFPGMPVREKKPFKTLYLLHGIFGNYTDWADGTRISRWAQDHNLAVIMPSGDNHFYVDCEATGEMYGEFIGKELVDVTRDLFPLSRKRSDTFIAGLSMGGYGAVRNGLKYWETFSHIGALSAGFILDGVIHSSQDSPMPTGRRSFYSHVFGNLDTLTGSDKDYKALIAELKKSGADIPKIYMACGTEDFLLEVNRDYHNYLKAQAVDVTYEEGPGSHEWDFWDTYIHKFLLWLPLEEASSGIGSGNVR